MTGMVYTVLHQNNLVCKSPINNTERKKMRLFLVFLSSLFLSFSTHAHADIGEIIETNGKVQIKTVKAKRIDGSQGVEINLGDLVKVRKKSSAFVKMNDDSEFQIGAKTTLIFDDFLFDSKNQKMRARIIEGALAYSGDKLVPSDDRQFENNSFTLTVRGTKFAGLYGTKSQLVLLKGAIGVEGKGDSQTLTAPLQSLIFDQSGVGEPFKMTFEELENFFVDNGLDLSRLVGPDFEQSLGDGKSTCVGSNCGG